MFYWRITKYNPNNRDESGAYTQEEWTSSSDINKTYNHTVLTAEAYTKTEYAYVVAVLEFMKCLKVSALEIAALEKHGFQPSELMYPAPMKKLYEMIQIGSLVALEDIQWVTQLALRENIWCKLKCSKMQVHFRYDFYMYIASIEPCIGTIQNIQSNGLFVESITSLPWS